MMTHTLELSQLQQTNLAPTSFYNPVLPLLTDRRVYEQKLRGYRYFVELVSTDWELQDNHPIPKSHKTVDVVVTEPTEAAIKLLVGSCGWLQSYEIVSCSQPEDGCEF